jgi:hypothetical protein
MVGVQLYKTTHLKNEVPLQAYPLLEAELTTVIQMELAKAKSMVVPIPPMPDIVNLAGPPPSDLEPSSSGPSRMDLDQTSEVDSTSTDKLASMPSNELQDSEADGSISNDGTTFGITTNTFMVTSKQVPTIDDRSPSTPPGPTTGKYRKLTAVSRGE